MKIYEIYLDVYWMENAILDALILTLTLFLQGKRVAPWRIVSAAAIGGAGSVFVLILGIKYGILYILAVLAIDAVMFPVAVKSPGSELLINIACFHGLAFVYTKLDMCVGRLGIPDSLRVVTPVIFTVLIMAVSRYQTRKRARRIYSVAITENGENVEMKALFDTGNSLTEPVSGRPVSIVEENAITRLWLEARPQKYKIIPFRSIGREHGLLEGTTVDELIIRKDDGQIVEKDAVVALYKGKLSKDGSYQMILNQGLF
ncbi:MAG: sigma-E processing peptidase SpoIIGA [Roseburia sp.]|nr:sigma-E processing peptidase SpoIIGA [Roseburia sp.]